MGEGAKNGIGERAMASLKPIIVLEHSVDYHQNIGKEARGWWVTKSAKIREGEE